MFRLALHWQILIGMAIGAAAGVERLVPFHLSRRYLQAPERVYEEVQAACRRAIVPPSWGFITWTF